MNDYKITQQVKRKSKRFAKPLSVTMVVLAVVLVILAIMFDTGLMMPAFLFAALSAAFSFPYLARLFLPVLFFLMLHNL